MNVTIHDVKFTFHQYPFKVVAKVKFDDWFRLPELIDLAAMKAYALGRRSKWKDYVDLFFFIEKSFFNSLIIKLFEIFIVVITVILIKKIKLIER